MHLLSCARTGERYPTELDTPFLSIRGTILRVYCSLMGNKTIPFSSDFLSLGQRISFSFFMFNMTDGKIFSVLSVNQGMLSVCWYFSFGFWPSSCVLSGFSTSEMQIWLGDLRVVIVFIVVFVLFFVLIIYSNLMFEFQNVIGRKKKKKTTKLFIFISLLYWIFLPNA